MEADMPKCPFCRQFVGSDRFSAHFQEHVADDLERPDLPPDGQPRVYCHLKCGSLTRMPEEVVQDYLVNPAKYDPVTVCAGCRKHFHQKEFVWTETGQNLHDYFMNMMGGGYPESCFSKAVFNPVIFPLTLGIICMMTAAFTLEQHMGWAFLGGAIAGEVIVIFWGKKIRRALAQLR
jgi:hypothetical protein